MRRFLMEHQIPGASLAVGHHGQILYARGFGYADLEKREPVVADSRFRIASISKPITAAAVLRLVEQGRLSLEDTLWGLLQLEKFGEPPADERWKAITVRHLLRHTAGWDRDLSIDPMFHSVEIAHALGVSPPAGPHHILRFMLRWKLDFPPGHRYAYSNFGYMLLGRIIETVAGQPYDQAVRQMVARPLEITSWQLGKTAWEDRATGEVRYYTREGRTGVCVLPGRVGEQVPQPYGAWYLEAMDSHGGWIASAPDLLRFAMSLGCPGTNPLLDKTRAQMLQRPEGLAGWHPWGEPRNPYYGLGWFVRPVEDQRVNAWHTGSLPGTSTLLVMRHDGYCWAVLFNTRDSGNGTPPAVLIDPLLHRAVDETFVKKA